MWLWVQSSDHVFYQLSHLSCLSTVVSQPFVSPGKVLGQCTLSSVLEWKRLSFRERPQREVQLPVDHVCTSPKPTSLASPTAGSTDPLGSLPSGLDLHLHPSPLMKTPGAEFTGGEKQEVETRAEVRSSQVTVAVHPHSTPTHHSPIGKGVQKVLGDMHTHAGTDWAHSGLRHGPV